MNPPPSVLLPPSHPLSALSFSFALDGPLQKERAEHTLASFYHQCCPFHISNQFLIP
jgi:hypothetical protein